MGRSGGPLLEPRKSLGFRVWVLGLCGLGFGFWGFVAWASRVFFEDWMVLYRGGLGLKDLGLQGQS